MRKYPRIKAFSLGAAVAFDGDDDEELDIDDIELEGEESEGTEEEDEDLEEDSGEEETEEASDEEDSRPRSRANTRIQKLVAQRKAAEAERLKIKQEHDRLQAQFNQLQQQRANPANDPQAVQAYLNALPPEQRVQAQLQLQMQQHQNQMQYVQFQMQDTADKSAYDSMAINNPVYRRYAEQVEAKLMALRTEQGLNAPRSEILKHLVGEMILSKKLAPTTKKQSDKTKKKHTVAPTNGKSNVQSNRGSGKTAKERLEGVKF